MLSVEKAVRDALIAKGEINFTDQEFPPDDRSLFVDPMNPPLKLQVLHMHISSICVNIFFKSLTCISVYGFKVVSEWMRPSEIAKEISISSQPCLFSGSVNSSDVCQV
jgi:hypothetical protein